MIKKLLTPLGLALAVLFLLWLAVGVSAGSPVGTAGVGAAQVQPIWTDFDISQKAGTAQVYPAMAANSSRGSYLVVWQEGSSFAPFGVSGKIVTAFGETLSETVVFTKTSMAETWPAVAFNGYLGNQYMVVWSDADVTAEYPEIYGQRVYTNGALISGTFRIDDNDDHHDFYPAIAHDSVNGPFLVVWSERWDPNPGPPVAQISGRLLDAAGAPLTDTFKVGDLDDYDQGRPAVAYNSTEQQYLVVWDDWYGGSVITGQIVAMNGVLVGGPFAVGTYTDTEQAFPDVAYDSRHNEYLVAWHDGGLRGGTGNSNVYGQVVSATGALVGDLLAISTASGDQRHPAVAYNARMGVYLVTWDDYRVTNYDIYGQWVKGGDPALMGDNVLITGQAGSYGQTYPAMAYNGFTRQFLVAWQDKRGYDVYGQRLTGLPYDLGIFPISLWTRPPVIREGVTVTVGAHVFNRFGPELSDVDVSFYLGDPGLGGTLIATRTVDFARGQVLTRTATTWDTTGLSGTQTLYVVVDPDDRIPEMLESNNVFSRTRTIRPPVSDTQPPTCTLLINDGDQVTYDGQVNLTIDAHDEGGAGVRRMYLREWWATPHLPGPEAVYVPGSRHGSWTYRDSGWQRYDPLYATSGYSYTLNGTPGIRYVQVWCRDGDGNVSEPPPAWDDINLVSPYAWTLSNGEWHLFRMQWTPGVSVAVTVTTIGGDADLFVWSPGITGTPDLVSNNSGTAVDAVSFTAVTGTYQIVAYGTDPYGSQYTIEWQAGGGAVQLGARPISAQAAGKESPEAPFIDPDETPPEFSAVPEFQVDVYLPVVLKNYP